MCTGVGGIAGLVRVGVGVVGEEDVGTDEFVGSDTGVPVVGGCALGVVGR
jgi:hypothetical protein